MGQDDTVTFGLTSWLPSVMFNCVFCHFPMWYSGSGMVLDCIDS